jgi:hypothetical protein
MKRWMTGAVVLGAVLMLGGCVAAPGPFDGTRTAADEVPAVAAHYVGDGELASSRYQGSAGGRELFLLRGTRGSQVCLVYTDGTDAGSGSTCGGGSWLRAQVANGAEFEVNISGFPDGLGRGEEQVSPWVRLVQPARED